MSAHAHSLAERHPTKRDTILSLSQSNAAFNDICGRFGRLWDCMNEVDAADGNTQRMRREVQHLETEMLAMFHGADERVSEASVVMTTEFLATVIERFSNRSSASV